MLHEFIAANREDIVARCRAKVSARSSPPPTQAEIEHGVPVFLDQLISTMRLGLRFSPEIGATAIRHGHDLLRQGFTISQVVHDYGDVCQSISELAVEKAAPISTDNFRMLNQCLDEAIAGAVTQYSRERHQSAVDDENARSSERLGFFAHELRNLIHTAVVAFDVLKTGNVGVTGSTAGVLARSLTGLSTLVSRSLAEVRLTQGIEHREPVSVADVIATVGAGAVLEARAKGIELTVLPVEPGVAVDVDRQILEAVLGNLLQNAFKFTRPRTKVALRVAGSNGRVLIEVEDECGGLPEGNVDELFHPFEQRGTDRTGLGLGLAFSRWGAEANGGRILTRSLPGKGCVFTIDLPRSTVAAVPA